MFSRVTILSLLCAILFGFQGTNFAVGGELSERVIEEVKLRLKTQEPIVTELERSLRDFGETAYDLKPKNEMEVSGLRAMRVLARLDRLSSVMYDVYQEASLSQEDKDELHVYLGKLSMMKSDIEESLSIDDDAKARAQAIAREILGLESDEVSNQYRSEHAGIGTVVLAVETFLWLTLGTVLTVYILDTVALDAFNALLLSVSGQLDLFFEMPIMADATLQTLPATSDFGTVTGIEVAKSEFAINSLSLVPPTINATGVEVVSSALPKSEFFSEPVMSLDALLALALSSSILYTKDAPPGYEDLAGWEDEGQQLTSAAALKALVKTLTEDQLNALLDDYNSSSKKGETFVEWFHKR